jgi:hypothetical protein
MQRIRIETVGKLIVNKDLSHLNAKSMRSYAFAGVLPHAAKLEILKFGEKKKTKNGRRVTN